ncbi:MAG TPA: hypothetical protein VFT69_15505 [Pseudolabrys sp.]|jgi:hypothetical protein|nr:hypothetical protein [Pseudolabrys sp.]
MTSDLTGHDAAHIEVFKQSDPAEAPFLRERRKKAILGATLAVERESQPAALLEHRP